MGIFDFQYRQPGPTIESAKEDSLIRLGISNREIPITDEELRPQTKTKSFRSAFSEARKQFGSDGIFEWNGKKYTTKLKGEESGKVPDRMAELEISTNPGIGNPELIMENRIGPEMPVMVAAGTNDPYTMEQSTTLNGVEGVMHRVPFGKSRFVANAIQPPSNGNKEYGNPDKEKIIAGMETGAVSIWQKLQSLFSSIQNPLFQDETWSKDRYNQ
jgi:hypothetical protein